MLRNIYRFSNVKSEEFTAPSPLVSAFKSISSVSVIVLNRYLFNTIMSDELITPSAFTSPLSTGGGVGAGGVTTFREMAVSSSHRLTFTTLPCLTPGGTLIPVTFVQLKAFKSFV